MIRAKITRKTGYDCAPEGHTIRHYPMGFIVTGQVAEWALADHAAARMFDPREETAANPEIETKAPPQRGRKRKGTE